MKKKGKSIDDKKMMLYDIMLESESFFILKELESVAQKKGLRSMLVKDLLQQLIDDNLVKTEKVGAQNIFWVLKTEESSVLLNQFQRLKKEKIECEQNFRREQEEYDNLLRNLKYTEVDFKKKLEEVKGIQNELNLKSKEVDILKKTDVREIEKLKDQNLFAQESIRRWNNNIYVVRQWVQNRTNHSGEIVDRLLGVKDIFDNWN